MSDGFTLGTIPNALVNMVFDGPMSASKVWRDYLRLTQAEVAGRMGITQAAYAQMESAKRPRKATLARIATAMGLEVDHLDF